MSLKGCVRRKVFKYLYMQQHPDEEEDVANCRYIEYMVDSNILSQKEVDLMMEDTSFGLYDQYRHDLFNRRRTPNNSKRARPKGGYRAPPLKKQKYSHTIYEETSAQSQSSSLVFRQTIPPSALTDSPSTPTSNKQHRISTNSATMSISSTSSALSTSSAPSAPSASSATSASSPNNDTPLAPITWEKMDDFTPDGSNEAEFVQTEDNFIYAKNVCDL